MTTGRDSKVVLVRALDADFAAVLDVLAAAEPDAPHGLVQALRRAQSEAMQAGELVVVTAALTAPAVDQLLRSAMQRPVAVVWIDAPSFAGRPTRADPGTLRLTTAGVPVAVIRAGDDLRTALDVPSRIARAHA